MPSHRQQSPGTGSESATTQNNVRQAYSSAVASQPQQPPVQQKPSQQNDQRDSTAISQPAASTDAAGFFMKPLTRPPDYRFNLYVKGLSPAMTTRGLYDLFKPYGNILACKILLDSESGSCRGGFVLFDNQDSCTEARRSLTQQGLYIAVAHESASIKNLPPADSSSPDTKPLIPEFDNSNDFPSLPSKPAVKKSLKKKTQATPPTLNTQLSFHQAESNSAAAISAIGTQLKEVSSSSAATRTAATEQTLGQNSSEPLSSNTQNYIGDYMLGPSFLDFDPVIAGNHQQFTYDSQGILGGFEWFPPGDKPYVGGVDDIDRYMNMLELNNAFATPQVSGNQERVNRSTLANGAHITNTTIDDFMLEDRPRRDSTLQFEKLPDGLKYQELFEMCALYGPLVLTSVDIRYINEDCSGQGRVTFESHKDAEAAYSALLEKKYDVRHGDSADMYPTEPGIDDYLYDQYFQQHQDFLRSGNSAPYESPDEMLTSIYQPGFLSTSGTTPFTPSTGESGEREHFWSTPIPDQPYQFDPSIRGERNSSLDIDAESLSNKHEKLSMLGISPQSISPTSASSSVSSLQPSHEWTGQSSTDSRRLSSDHYQNTQSTDSSESGESNDSSKPLSYSDIVKVPAKPSTLALQNKEDAHQQDLRKRGNTNKSLDEKEYRLNLFLKNLEPDMDEFKLYEICVEFGPVMSCRTITTNHGVCTGLGFVMYINNQSVDMAIEGLKKRGYHAEVAVQSATNKLRCKTLSDMLFIQNIPSHVKESKLRDLFRPYTILTCNILRDPRTSKSRGVGFIKVKDTKIAERFIEEYHGRVLGKDWKLPLQVSPAK
ncbi:hypothetical protein BGZ76_007188, partial [Entomortierella beljakovae]